jgi:hypothetical protein
MSFESGTGDPTVAGVIKVVYHSAQDLIEPDLTAARRRGGLDGGVGDLTTWGSDGGDG